LEVSRELGIIERSRGDGVKEKIDISRYNRAAEEVEAAYN